ncbi:MAG: hypothetical protein KKC28_01625 [Verrucomicrobia bacterium]|nr:hypothetical protein [Verrucomicrobiota bacterium]MBU1855666.1 hypothetical protein [Verrucomicrobiota bacterium]
MSNTKRTEGQGKQSSAIYFDCLCEIEPRYDKDAAVPWSVNDALRWMDYCGISGACLI